MTVDLHRVKISETAPNRALKTSMNLDCKHPQVRVVSRDEDAEFVECLQCGEVFDSEEFHDMQIEEEVLAKEDEEA